MPDQQRIWRSSFWMSITFVVVGVISAVQGEYRMAVIMGLSVLLVYLSWYREFHEMNMTNDRLMLVGQILLVVVILALSLFEKSLGKLFGWN